eukprot:jgi/Botrbrau1/12839/Bobra.0045s0008.1
MSTWETPDRKHHVAHSSANGRSDRTRKSRRTLQCTLVALIVAGFGFSAFVASSIPSLEKTKSKRHIEDEMNRTEETLVALKGQVENLTRALEDAKVLLETYVRSEPPNPTSTLKDSGLPVNREGKAWMTIGIPTVPRKGGADYLTRTVATLLQELPMSDTDPLFGKIIVLVMNNQPGSHPVFAQLKERIESGDKGDILATKGCIYVRMVENPGTLQDTNPEAPEPDDLNNPKNLPGREVRKQTRDLVTLMNMAKGLSHYYMFMEDDFRVCPFAIRIIAYVISKLNAIPGAANWLALRVSYGMNGIVLKTEDLESLSGYMMKYTDKLPPDLLWVEWYSGRKPELYSVIGRGRNRRILYVYRYNLLDHIGFNSSFAVRAPRPAFPVCYDSMANVWSLAFSERFLARSCKASDISPCRFRGSAGERWTQQVVDWPHVVDEEDHPKRQLSAQDVGMSPALRPNAPEVAVARPVRDEHDAVWGSDGYQFVKDTVDDSTGHLIAATADVLKRAVERGLVVESGDSQVKASLLPRQLQSSEPTTFFDSASTRVQAGSVNLLGVLEDALSNGPVPQGGMVSSSSRHRSTATSTETITQPGTGAIHERSAVLSKPRIFNNASRDADAVRSDRTGENGFRDAPRDRRALSGSMDSQATVRKAGWNGVQQGPRGSGVADGVAVESAEMRMGGQLNGVGKEDDSQKWLVRPLESEVAEENEAALDRDEPGGDLEWLPGREKPFSAEWQALIQRALSQKRGAILSE